MNNIETLFTGSPAPHHFIADTQYVIPAEIAGIQKPRTASANHIHVVWVPAIHAGMTCYFYGYE